MAFTEEDDSLDNVTRRASNIAPDSKQEEQNLEALSVAEQISRLKIGDRQVDNDRSSRHSHTSELSALATHSNRDAERLMNMSSNDSFDFNDSCASFASFGGASDEGGSSKSSLQDSAGELAEAKEGFCQLDSDPQYLVNRQNLLLTRTPSSRLVRAASLRCPTLQLIEEHDE